MFKNVAGVPLVFACRQFNAQQHATQLVEYREHIGDHAAQWREPGGRNRWASRLWAGLPWP